MPATVSQIVTLSLLCAAGAALGAETTYTSLPTKSGVAGELRTVIDAPCGSVARLAGDPGSFTELLPAAEAKVVGQRQDALVVEVAMREPWPVGVVRWTETVTRRREGTDFVVERRAQTGGYFRHLSAVWRITPETAAPGCRVSYRVALELSRWVPAWMLRRGNQKGMSATVERLRRMSERLISQAPTQR